MNFIPDTRQTFFEKNQDIKNLCGLKTIWSHCTLISIKLRQAHVYQHPIVHKQEHLLALHLLRFSHMLRSCAYSLTNKIVPNRTKKTEQTSDTKSFYSNTPYGFVYKNVRYEAAFVGHSSIFCGTLSGVQW